jgi:hypothetical protein
MTAFGQRHPSNPSVVWLGYSPSDRRVAVQWQLVSQLEVTTMVSKGLDPSWQSVLRSVGSNFFRFVTECQKTYGDKYDRNQMPAESLSLIIGIVHPDSSNEVELIDGSHRLASMILNQVKSVSGYVGHY